MPIITSILSTYHLLYNVLRVIFISRHPKYQSIIQFFFSILQKANNDSEC